MASRIGDHRIHTYTAGEAGLLVNSYLVETVDGVVLVDANLLLSDIRALQARIAALHKPLLGVFVTHGHPDHFNGLPLLADGVPVFATAEVTAAVARLADAKREQWQPVYGAEWPDRHRVPDQVVPAGAVVELAGLPFSLHAVGPAESDADSYLRLGDQAFIGDLAFHGIHPYTADGHTGRWITALDTVSAELDGAVLLPGHGAPGGLRMLADQRRYLMMYREVVGRLAGRAPSLTEAQRAELTAVMTAYLPDAPLTWMIGLGADAVAAELAAARPVPV